MKLIPPGAVSAGRAATAGLVRDEPDPALILKRRKLELARTEVLRQIEVAHAEAHRVMLRRALEALDRDLAHLP